jgi:hypothetical protein
MNSRFIVMDGILGKDSARCIDPNTTMWSRHSRRMVPISLSAYAFCHGEPDAIGLSRMPVARNRRGTVTP